MALYPAIGRFLCKEVLPNNRVSEKGHISWGVDLSFSGLDERRSGPRDAAVFDAAELSRVGLLRTGQ